MWLHSPFLTTTALFPLIPCLGPLAGRLLNPIAAPASVGNNPIVARVPKQSGNHPKVLGESGPGAPPAGSRRPCHARGTCPGPAASWGGSRRAPRGGPAAMCSEPGGAAAAAFALSTFPAPRRAPSLPICGAHARSERRARGWPAAAAAAAAAAAGAEATRRGAGRGRRRGGGPGARRPGRQLARGERGEQRRAARAAAWRGSDARSRAATASPPRP